MRIRAKIIIVLSNLTRILYLKLEEFAEVLNQSGAKKYENISYLKSSIAIPPDKSNSFIGRYREILSDPLNMLINRVPGAGKKSGNYVTLHNGNIVKYKGRNSYYGDFSEILIINRGVHEPLEEYVFQELLGKLSVNENHTMLELGAYWAHYSMWMKLSFPNTYCTLVEPDKNGIETGKYNFKINGFEGDFIRAKVCSDEFNVDDFLFKSFKGKLTILHSDIQGYEKEMLLGASQSLDQQKIDHVLVSTHSDYLHYECIRILESKGYTIRAHADYDSETTSCDGFIYATSKEIKSYPTFPHILGREKLAEKFTKTNEFLLNYFNSFNH